MSETVKLIIEIPKKIINEIKDNAMFLGSISSDIRWDVTSAIVNGILLDDVKLKIEQDMCFDMFNDYGNETAIHKELWEIFDNIGKGDEE